MISNETVLETTTGISLPAGTILGYRENGMPIYNIAGGAEVVAGTGDDDDADDSDASDDDDSDADDSDDDAFVPPTREEYERLIAEKRKADSESAARKRLLRQAGLDPKTGKPVQRKVVLDSLDDDDDDDDDASADDAKAALDAAKGVSRAKQEKAFQRQLEREIAKTERRVKDQSTVLIAAVPTALQDEGWNGKNLDRILKLMDLDNVSVDDDGEIDGLFEEIEDLKKDFPEFFKRTRMKDAAKDIPDTKAVGGGKKTAAPAAKDLSWTDQLKNSLYGK